MKTYSEADLAALMRGLNIPSCPAILTELNAELRKENCKQQRVVALISKDVALSAAVLKITNSASASTSRKITSIKDAITLLGTQNLVNFVVGDFLKRSLSIPKSKGLDRFWDKAAHNATVCGLLADRFRGVRRETAYCFGLFHDCGIPVMMQRYPDYKKTYNSLAKASRRLLQQKRHNTVLITRSSAICWRATGDWPIPLAKRSAHITNMMYWIPQRTPGSAPTPAP